MEIRQELLDRVFRRRELGELPGEFREDRRCARDLPLFVRGSQDFCDCSVGAPAQQLRHNALHGFHELPPVSICRESAKGRHVLVFTGQHAVCESSRLHILPDLRRQVFQGQRLVLEE